VFAAVLVLTAPLWSAPAAAQARTLLLLTQELPQSPVRPLEALTAPPAEARLLLEGPEGPVVADLYSPLPRLPWGTEHPRAAIVLALGVALDEADRGALRHLAATLARLGYVVLWPRSAPLEAGAPALESPQTFVTAVEHLRRRQGVDPARVSLLGFSAGASVALVAAADPAVAADVRALVFFGGYYDLPEYLVSVAAGETVLDGEAVPWEPEADAVRRVREVPAALGAPGIAAVLEATTRAEAQARLRAAPAEERAMLDRFNPAAHRAGLGARVFILHDRADGFVPFAESVRLRRALPPEQVGAFLLTDLFRHAQPRAGLSWGVARDVVALYAFVGAALRAV
jgi:pimeloyl-ACP methyl ester carboxylesterase